MVTAKKFHHITQFSVPLWIFYGARNSSKTELSIIFKEWNDTKLSIILHNLQVLLLHNLKLTIKKGGTELKKTDKQISLLLGSAIYFMLFNFPFMSLQVSMPNWHLICINLNFPCSWGLLTFKPQGWGYSYICSL